MGLVNLDFRFVNDEQSWFFENQKRNSCFNGGYGNGKTFVGCMKAVALAAKFPGYRTVIGRWRYKDLMQTTVQTFFKVCPKELYDERYGGRWTESKGYLKLINGSEFLFMHFDDADENAVRSLEVNSVLLDQAEELGENIYLHLDSRVGRWDMAEVPEDLIKLNPDWPRNRLTGKPIAPSYMMVLCNPADEGELHWIWQRYHPDSVEHQEKYTKSHYYVEASSRSNVALNSETLDAMESRDEVWKQRFIEGKWGKAGGNVHAIHPSSILEITDEKWIQNLLRKANLYRAFDHGGTTPASCVWFASWGGWYFAYREYYAAGRLISEHRLAIGELSGGEEYRTDVADPDIFVKRQQKAIGGFTGFWSVAEEYATKEISDSPPINWIAGDNNELATRNRINEWLRINPAIQHPITGELGASRLYFIRRNHIVPNGCFNVIRETQSQKYLLLDTINGRPVYSDERSDKISDHSYDCLRYFVSMHANFPKEPIRKPSANSFTGIRNRLKALKQIGYFDNYGLPSN